MIFSYVQRILHEWIQLFIHVKLVSNSNWIFIDRLHELCIYLSVSYLADIICTYNLVGKGERRAG